MAKTKAAKKKVIKIPQKYFDAVATGVAWLDLTLGRKEWLSQMDMKYFDIQHGDVCVAGNVFQDAMFDGSHDGYDSFLNAVHALGGDGGKTSERFGFSASSTRGWQYLQDLWVNAITKMKAEARK